MSDQPPAQPPPNPRDMPTREPESLDASSGVPPTIAPPGDSSDSFASSVLDGGVPDMSFSEGALSAKPKLTIELPKVDGYQIISPIGQGGMGTVWQAVQHSTRRNVALKLIGGSGLTSERSKLRFDREVEITARLEHPNIARVYDSGINRGVYFYAMELIDGLPLDVFVARKRHLSQKDILRLFVLICRAVSYAHQRGVLHRDLKPGNILVSPDCQPHVLDFGLAKALLQAGMEAGISVEGEVAGTPGFMSPEQARGGSDLDVRSDVYALGVIMYRVLTNQMPHDLSGTYLDVLRRVSEEDPKRPRVADPAMDSEVEAMLLHALEREPAKRYATAEEMARDIENYLNGNPIIATPPSALYYLRKRVRKYRVQLSVVAGILFLIGVAALLTIGLKISHHQTLQQAENSQSNFVLANKNKRAEQIAEIDIAIASGDKELDQRHWKEADGLFRGARAQSESIRVFPTKPNLALWDLGRRAPAALMTLAAPVGKNASIAITSGPPVYLSDGRRALAGYEDGIVRLWDVSTGQLLSFFPAHRGPVRSVAASTDGLTAITGGENGEVKLWNLTAGTLRTEFRNPSMPLKGWVTHVAISPDGQHALTISGASAELLASPNYNDTLTLWNPVTARPRLTSNFAAGILDNKGLVTQVAFSPDSSELVAAGAEVVVWATKDGKRINALPGSGTAAAFSPDGLWIAAGASNGTLRILDLATQIPTTLKAPDGHASAIWSIWFDPERDSIITASEDGYLRAANLRGEEIWSLPVRGEINSATISSDGTTALTSSDDGLAAWLAAPPVEARLLSNAGPFPDAMFSRDGRLAVSRRTHRRVTVAGATAEAVLWDVATGRRLTPRGFPSDRCSGIAISGDGRTIAHVWGEELSIWSLDPPHEVRRVTIPSALPAAGPTPVAVSDDGSQVAVCAADNSALLYRVAIESDPLKLRGHDSIINAITFSLDGQRLITGGDNHTARVWDTTAGAALAVLHGHETAVNAVAISGDGKFAITASGSPLYIQSATDNTVRVWELPGGKMLNVLGKQSGQTGHGEHGGHDTRVRSVAISADGAQIASASDDGNVILWDRPTGEILRTFHSSTGPVLALSFDASGHALLCGSDRLNLWNLGAPAVEHEMEPSLTAARGALQSNPQDTTAMLSLGKWYAYRGQAAWASRFLQSATHQEISALDLARCQWMRGDMSAAELEFKSVSPQEAPPFYVNLCMTAMRSESRRPR